MLCELLSQSERNIMQDPEKFYSIKSKKNIIMDANNYSKEFIAKYMCMYVLEIACPHRRNQ